MSSVLITRVHHAFATQGGSDGIEKSLASWQGPVLMQFPQLGDDSIAVIWTMVERHDAESPRAPFWLSLPQQLHSGLSMSDALLQTLQGIPAYTELATSRKVLISV